MSKDDLIKATNILQKHQPNRFPLMNNYIKAMEEYAKEKVIEERESIKEWLIDEDFEGLAERI